MAEFELIDLCERTYRRREIIGLDKGYQDEACRKLNEYGLLSTKSIGAVVGVSSYRVKNALKYQTAPVHRGTLNPQHMSMLRYMGTLGFANNLWVKKMVAEGTSISTINVLTGHSLSTLWRKLHE